MVALFLAAAWLQESDWSLAQKLFKAPVEPEAVQLAADIRRTYECMETLSCTVELEPGKRLTVEYKRPNRYRIKAYPKVGSELERDAVHDGFETSVVDTKDPLKIIRFTEPDREWSEFGDPMTAISWPPDSLRLSLVALLEGKDGLVGGQAKRFHLGEKGVDHDGTPTIELLLIDSIPTQRADGRPTPTLARVIVGSKDHLIRSIWPLGVIQAQTGMVSFVPRLESFYDYRVNSPIDDSEFVLQKKPGQFVTRLRPPTGPNDLEFDQLNERARQRLRSLHSLSFTSQWSHSKELKNVVRRYEFALSRSGAGRIEVLGDGPENRKLLAVSDGNTFRYSSDKGEIELHADLFDGLSKVGAFGRPAKYADYIGEVTQSAGGGSPIPPLCSPRAVAIMADFFGRHVDGLDLRGKAFTEPMRVNEQGLPVWQRSTQLVDVLGDPAFESNVVNLPGITQFHQVVTLDPKTNLVRSAILESNRVYRNELMWDQAEELVQNVVFDPSFNPLLFRADPQLRSKFDLTEYSGLQLPPFGLPDRTIDGNRRDIGGKTLILLYDSRSAKAALALPKPKMGRIFGWPVEKERSAAISATKGFALPQLFDGQGWDNRFLKHLALSELPCWIYIDRNHHYWVIPATDPPQVYIDIDR